MIASAFGVLFDGFAYGMLLFLLGVGLSVTLGMMNFVNLAHYLNGVDPEDEADWPRQHEWLAKRLNDMHRVFEGSRFRQFSLLPTPTTLTAPAS